MKFRNTGHDAIKVETQMTSMIDVVFLLLIFFIVTLKIADPEGDFNINMPVGDPDQAQTPEDEFHDDIHVRLVAAADGSLKELLVNSESFGNGDAAFAKLNEAVRQLVVVQGKESEVEIDSDFNLRYEFLNKAVGTCMGRYDPVTDSIIRYVERVRFKKSKRPAKP